MGKEKTLLELMTTIQNDVDIITDAQIRTLRNLQYEEKVAFKRKLAQAGVKEGEIIPESVADDILEQIKQRQAEIAYNRAMKILG